ncbi:hypothetical protein GCM10009565_58870 [Amycolatopsis albidoflavus]
MAKERGVDDTENRLAVVNEPQRHCAKRNSVDEIGGPVNRIEHPVDARVSGRAGLLAKEADIWYALREVVSYEMFNSHLNLGHQVTIALGLNFAGLAAHEEIDCLVHGVVRNDE